MNSRWVGFCCVGHVTLRQSCQVGLGWVGLSRVLLRQSSWVGLRWVKLCYVMAVLFCRVALC